MNPSIKSSRLVGTSLVIETDGGTEEYAAPFLVAALMIFIAKGSGRIEPEESAEMIDLVEDHFHLESAESLELLTRAMAEMADNKDLGSLLSEFGKSLSDQEKEDIAVMALKVIAADGRREVAELEQLDVALQTIQVSPEIKHRAFDRYFEETMPGE